MDTPTALVYKPKDAFRFRGIAADISLMVCCAPFAVAVIASGTVRGTLLFVAVYALLALGLWFALRRRVILTAHDLIVQGRLSRLQVPLADLTAVHYEAHGTRVDRHRLIVWVAATGRRPFRIYFVTGYDTFVTDVRRRAAACGAPIDIDAPPEAAPPSDTRRFFTLL